MSENYDFIIWIMFFFVIFIIIGLYIGEYTPLNLNERKKAIDLEYISENFTPSISSTNDQSEGASGLFNWGLPDDTPSTPSPPAHQQCQPPVPHPQQCQQSHQQCQQPHQQDCSKCDILNNRDIDKYVLKSSIPPCQDTSEFITKNMMNANPDFKDYILKSEVKPCEKVDTSQYILKSQIPACPTCPICPECPICPICPPQVTQKCKEIYEYNIREHPDIAKYISIDDLHKHYVSKDNIINNDVVQNYIKQNCNKQPPVKPQQPPVQPQQPPAQPNYQKHINKIYEEDKWESQLKQDVLGYYAGDNLFAGV